MKSKWLFGACALVALTGAQLSWAAELELDMKNKKFSHAKLTVKVGDTVKFKNQDTYSHNVFSLSDTKTFDLGSFPQGQARPVVFDKSGTVEVECAIHPDMKATITVVK